MSKCPKCGSTHEPWRNHTAGTLTCIMADCGFTCSATDWDKVRFDKAEEVKPKPRRMQANSSTARGSVHATEHDEVPSCIHSPLCWPVEKPKSRRMQANPKHSGNSHHCREHDENENCHIDGCQPVPQYNDVELVRDNYGCLRLRGCGVRHAECVSLKGFVGYVYADGTVRLDPVWRGNGQAPVEFPVAVRFVKEA